MTEQATAIANVFVQTMREWLTDDELTAVDSLNKEHAGDESYCATADFCDCNVAVWDAFTEIVGREPDLENEPDCELIHNAIQIAKAAGFCKMKLYPALDAAQSPIKLQGPSGGDDIAKSQFMLIPERGLWQWAAWDVDGNLCMVAEVPFVLADVCDTVYGALWAIRDVAGQYIKPTRAGRNQ